jgi:hypothetical protein
MTKRRTWIPGQARNDGGRLEKISWVLSDSEDGLWGDFEVISKYRDGWGVFYEICAFILRYLLFLDADVLFWRRV